MKSLASFETLLNIYQSTRRKISEDMNAEDQLCENFTLHEYPSCLHLLLQFLKKTSHCWREGLM